MLKKFNIIDWCIVLFIVLIVSFGIIKVTTTDNNDNLVSVEVVFEAKEVPMGLINNVAVGDKLYDSISDNYIGTITAVDYTEFRSLVVNQLNQFEYKVIPDKYNLIVTVDAKVMDNEKGYNIANRAIIVGTQVRVKSKKYVFNGDIIDLKII